MPGLGHRVIVTVTLNAALDVTYAVAELRPGASHRVSSVVETAGGKGVNVASVLAQSGLPVVATGIVGGCVGSRIRADLDSRAVRHDFVDCAGESRRTLTVVSGHDGDATVFNELGPAVSAPEWQGFLAHLGRLVRHTSAAVVVASGSLPRGLPPDAYAQLLELAHEAGCRTVLDTSGEALRAALAAGPDVVKPNRDELLEVTGADNLAAGVAALRRMGARNVLASAGADGMFLVGEGLALAGRVVPPVRGNPTGAGDAAVAAVAAGLAAQTPWDDLLAESVAWSAAAVLKPVAGDVDRADVERLRAAVVIRPAGAPRS
jgi:1-phosphofructokinase family hexose kinase